MDKSGLMLPRPYIILLTIWNGLWKRRTSIATGWRSTMISGSGRMRAASGRGNMRKVIGFCLLGLLVAGAASGQQKKLKVLISADMEGIGGVSTWAVQAAAGGREYEKFRRLMTLEVNAAMAGGAEAGAT